MQRPGAPHPKKPMPDRPTIAITLGDPCGIGPEVVAKALAIPTIQESCVPLVIGSQQVLEQAAAVADVALKIAPVSSTETTPGKDAIAVLDPGPPLDLADLSPLAPTNGHDCQQR